MFNKFLPHVNSSSLSPLHLQYQLNWTNDIGDTNFLCNWVNPLSANSDQQQFSPNNIHTLSRDIVMRINKMITIEKMLCSFIKFSQLIVKGGVWRSVWRICMWILGPKGLSILQHLKDTQSRVFVEECLLRLLQC